MTPRVTTTDPISGRDVPDPEHHPFVIEGKGENALKIFFESEETRQIYLDLQVEHPGKDFTVNLDNPVSMG